MCQQLGLKAKAKHNTVPCCVCVCVLCREERVGGTLMKRRAQRKKVLLLTVSLTLYVPYPPLA